MVLSLWIFIHGITSIGRVSSLVVPFMAVFYFVFAVIAIIYNIENLPSGLSTMFSMAFSFESVAGGVGGTIVASMLSLVWERIRIYIQCYSSV